MLLSEFVWKNRAKYYILLGVVGFAIGLSLYLASLWDWQGWKSEIQLQDDPLDLADQIKAANRTKGNSTLVFATVVIKNYINIYINFQFNGIKNYN